MTYAEQLRHPKWQRRRLEMLSAADWKCTRCTGADKTLHVHHRFYRAGAEPWEYADHELVVLCEDCHDFAHSGPEVPQWAHVVCTLVDASRDILPAAAIPELEKRLLIACTEIINRDVSALHDSCAGQELAALRAADQAWRLANPEAAAEFDARKREMVERIRGRPH